MKTGTTFRDFYKKAAESKPKISPAKRFVAEIAALTKRSETTVRMWIYGHQEPEGLVKDVLANHFKVSAEELFPPKTKGS